MMTPSALIRVMAIAALLGGAPAAAPFVAGPALAQAQPAGPEARARMASELIQALALAEIMEILREEGLAYAQTLDAELLNLRGGQGWARAADRIYDAGRMAAEFGALLAAALPDDIELASLALDFYASDRGQRIVQMENAARRAMLDDDADTAARDSAAELLAARDPRLDLIQEIIAANDFIEQNVAGGLNSNFAFWLGLRDSGAPDFDVPESEMIANVWSQEDLIREDTTTWLIAYLALAYRPLSDDDLRAYLAYSHTPQGRALNRALFAAFDTLFNGISRDLGFEAGRVLSQQDL